jgi:hypothetical protein
MARHRYDAETFPLIPLDYRGRTTLTTFGLILTEKEHRKSRAHESRPGFASFHKRRPFELKPVPSLLYLVYHHLETKTAPSSERKPSSLLLYLSPLGSVGQSGAHLLSRSSPLAPLRRLFLSLPLVCSTALEPPVHSRPPSHSVAAILGQAQEPSCTPLLDIIVQGSSQQLVRPSVLPFPSLSLAPLLRIIRLLIPSKSGTSMPGPYKYSARGDSASASPSTIFCRTWSSIKSQPAYPHPSSLHLFALVLPSTPVVSPSTQHYLNGTPPRTQLIPPDLSTVSRPRPTRWRLLPLPLPLLLLPTARPPSRRTRTQPTSSTSLTP